MKEQENDRKPNLYEIFHGEVASLQTYGAFIRIPQCKKQGLLHKSQMSTARIEDPSEMLAKGEKVFCKVISLGEEGDKISLSMKVVNQTTGQDLDPNNVQSSQDEKKRRQWNFKGKDKIELGAELNTTCRRCGGHGHLTMDCFMEKGNNQYDLVPDMDKLLEMMSADQQLSTSSKKKKKKEKKKSKKKRYRSSSETSESESEEKRKVKKLKSDKQRYESDKFKHKHEPRSDQRGNSPNELRFRSKHDDDDHRRRPSPQSNLKKKKWQPQSSFADDGSDSSEEERKPEYSRSDSSHKHVKHSESHSHRINDSSSLKHLNSSEESSSDSNSSIGFRGRLHQNKGRNSELKEKHGNKSRDSFVGKRKSKRHSSSEDDYHRRSEYKRDRVKSSLREKDRGRLKRERSYSIERKKKKHREKYYERD